MRNLSRPKRVLRPSRWFKPTHVLYTDIPKMRQFYMSFHDDMDAKFWAWFMMSQFKAKGYRPWIAELAQVNEYGSYTRRVCLLYNKSMPKGKMTARLREAHQRDI